MAGGSHGYLQDSCARREHDNLGDLFPKTSADEGISKRQWFWSQQGTVQPAWLWSGNMLFLSNRRCARTSLHSMGSLHSCALFAFNYTGLRLSRNPCGTSLWFLLLRWGRWLCWVAVKQPRPFTIPWKSQRYREFDDFHSQCSDWQSNARDPFGSWLMQARMLREYSDSRCAQICYFEKPKVGLDSSPIPSCTILPRNLCGSAQRMGFT